MNFLKNYKKILFLLLFLLLIPIFAPTKNQTFASTLVQFNSLSDYFDQNKKDYSYFFKRINSQNNLSLLPYSSSKISVKIGNQYLLKELFKSNFFSNFNYKKSNFSLQFSHFGFSEFGTIETSFAYCRFLFPKMTFGISFHYIYDYAEHYSPTHSITFDLSFSYFLTKKWLLSISAKNPACLKYNITSKQYLPTSFRLDNFFFFMRNGTMGVYVEQLIKGAFNGGIQLSYFNQVYGITFETSFRFSSINLFFHLKNWEISVDNHFHYQLGYSPNISLTLHLTKNK